VDESDWLPGAAEGEVIRNPSMFCGKTFTIRRPIPRSNRMPCKHLQVAQVKQDCKQLDALADEYTKRTVNAPAR